MDEYDLLLNEINREKIIKEEKKFWRGKKWNKKQRKELEKQGKPPLKLNRIKKGEIMSSKDVDKEIMEIFDTIFRVDPMFFSRVDKGAIETQREQMRGHMGLTDTGGMTITEENLKKLMADLSESRPAKSGVYLDGVFYKDFIHFCSALLEKYFTREEKNES